MNKNQELINSFNLSSTRVKNENEFFYHVINTEVDIKYNIKEGKLEFFCNGEIIESFDEKIEFDEFVFKCNSAFKGEVNSITVQN
jgi:hypothetical protein